MSASPSSCAIIGVGASAGGLDAFKRLLGALPAQVEFAFVLIQHLDPSQESQLADVLGPSCALPVVRVEDGQLIEAGHVYVVPERQEATLVEGRIRLQPLGKDCKTPIDTFMSSLAANNEYRGCGVLLSGTDLDRAQEISHVGSWRYDIRTDQLHWSDVQDITERKAEEQAQLTRTRQIQVANKLLGLFVSETDERIYDKALDIILAELESEAGVLGYVDEDGDLVCPTMSRLLDECEMEDADKCIVYKQQKWIGLWGRALQEKKTLYSNDEAIVPVGHVPVHRNMAAPIVFHDKVIGLINLANKPTDYTDEDRELIDGITARFAPVLYAWIQQDLLEKERQAAELERETERVRLRAIIEDIPIGISLIGGDGTVLEVNETVHRIWAGASTRDSVVEDNSPRQGSHHETGKPLLPHEWPAERSRATGERVEDIVDIARADGTGATIRIDAMPVKDASGKVVRVVVITEDVTQRLQAERLKEAIGSIGVSASSTFDVDEIVHRLLTAGCEALHTEMARFAALEEGAWVAKEGLGKPELESTEIFSATHFTDDLTLLDDMKPLVIDNTGSDARVKAEAFAEIEVAAALIVPVMTRGEFMGVLAFCRQRPVAFTPPEIEFASQLMTVASFALDNAALYKRERLIADTLQEAMLVPPEPVRDLELSYMYQSASSAANVGGDFWDVFSIDDALTGILIGDVSGKGLEAARHTSLVRVGARAYALIDSDPVVVIGNLNRLVHRSTPLDAFATVFFGVLDRVSGELRYCGAGHPAGIVRRKEGVEVLHSRSSIVGAFCDAGFVSDSTKLGHGDALVLFTDGVIEARRDRELFGEPRVTELVADLDYDSLSDAPQRILDEVLEFSGGELRDDIVLLCLTRQLWDDERG